MIKELDDVILACDLPEHGLSAGDIGTVVLVHRGAAGYEVEFTALDGDTIAVATLSRRRLTETAGRWLKLVSGLVMLSLGVVLLWKPEWLG